MQFASVAIWYTQIFTIYGGIISTFVIIKMWNRISFDS